MSRDMLSVERELLERIARPLKKMADEPARRRAIKELRALLDQPAESVIDLDALDWESVKEAAAESKWMPPEYMRNEWVADVCEFLRAERSAQHQGEPVAYADPKAFENFGNLAHLGGLYAHEWMWAEQKPGMVALYAEQPAPVAVDAPSRDELLKMLRHFASCANVVQVGTGAMDFVARLNGAKP